MCHVSYFFFNIAFTLVWNKVIHVKRFHFCITFLTLYGILHWMRENTYSFLLYILIYDVYAYLSLELVKNINILRDQTKWCPNDVCFLFRKLRCQDIFIKIKYINIKFKITYISNFPASFSDEFPYLQDKKIVAGNSKNSFCRSFVY